MRAKLEVELQRIAPMPALEMMAVAMLETGLPYSELVIMPQSVVNDYLVLKEAQARASQ